MQKEISVVIPLYNKKKYIQRTLDSVFIQTFQNFECIIIDSSTDGSTDIVCQYADPRIIHITLDRTSAAKARNLGASLAKTDFIAFLDADDEWQPDHLETLLHIRKKFPDAGLYSTPYVKLKLDGRPMVMLFVGIPPPPWEGYLENYLLTSSRGDEPVNSSTAAVPRNIFESFGGFPEELDYGEDQFLWGKIALGYPVAYSWNGLTIYHTEASDRICNEPREIQEHPFSVYLKRELDQGRIPEKDRLDCFSYIKRKRHSHLFSSFIFRKKYKNSTTDTNPLVKVTTIRENIPQTLNLSANFVHPLFKFYNSSLHDTIRLLLCRVYGSYNPGSVFNPMEKERFP
jgi:glycosyltransferase involved in cell wall biosynthesis